MSLQTKLLYAIAFAMVVGVLTMAGSQLSQADDDALWCDEAGGTPVAIHGRSVCFAPGIVLRRQP